MLKRDYNHSKKDLWNRMTGNVPDLTNLVVNGGGYPTAQWTTDELDIEPL